MVLVRFGWPPNATTWLYLAKNSSISQAFELIEIGESDCACQRRFVVDDQ
jgi:hypothetical protein